MVEVKTDAVSVSAGRDSPTVLVHDIPIASVKVTEGSVSVGSTNTAGISVKTRTEIIEIIPSGEAYEGPYSITPGKEAQVLNIKGLTAKENIIIEPVPDNYGLISWNGSTLTIT